MPYCENCGNKVSETTKFCSNCGRKISGSYVDELSDQDINDNSNFKNQSETTFKKNIVSEKFTSTDEELKTLWSRLVLDYKIKDLLDQFGNAFDWWDNPDLTTKLPEENKEMFEGLYFSQEEIDIIKSKLPENIGIITYAEGDLYIGEIRNGKKEGKGTYLVLLDKAELLDKASMYEKNLAVLESFISERNPKNVNKTYIIEYFGNWIDNRKFGYGFKINTKLGKFDYIGNWENDLYNGIGTVYNFYKSKVVGEFSSGELNGSAVSYFENGSKEYDGNFILGQKSGNGTSYKTDGITKLFEGIWKEDKFIQGVQYHDNGEVKFSGEFNDGDIIKGKMYSDSGKLEYEGDFGYEDEDGFQNDEPHGNGIKYFENGDIYEGDFVNGQLSGKGKFSWKDGDVYEGDFVEGEISGQGKISYANGDVYEGGFLDGEFHGEGFVSSKNEGTSGKVFHDSGKLRTGYTIWKSLWSSKKLRTSQDEKEIDQTSPEKNDSKKGQNGAKIKSPIKPRDGAGIR